MSEAECGYISLNALVVIYKQDKFFYSLNLQSSYSPKQEFYNLIPVFKKNGSILLGNVIESGLVFPSAIAIPDEWVEYTELIELKPVYYRSKDYLQEASYRILCGEFNELLDDPGQIQKDSEYFESLVTCLCNKDKIRNYCSTLCFLDLILLYFDTQKLLVDIQENVADSWTEKQISVYQFSLGVIFEIVAQTIPQEWSSLSKERQMEFKDLFKEQEHWEWLKHVEWFIVIEGEGLCDSPFLFVFFYWKYILICVFDCFWFNYGSYSKRYILIQS